MIPKKKTRGQRKPKKYELDSLYSKANTLEMKKRYFEHFKSRASWSKFYSCELRHFILLALDLHSELTSREIIDITGLPSNRVYNALSRYAIKRPGRTPYLQRRKKEGIRGYLYKLNAKGKRRLAMYQLNRLKYGISKYPDKGYLERRRMRKMAKEAGVEITDPDLWYAR